MLIKKEFWWKKKQKNKKNKERKKRGLTGLSGVVYKKQEEIRYEHNL